MPELTVWSQLVRARIYGARVIDERDGSCRAP